MPAGRPKGAKNKRTVELQAAVAATGESPLDYMLRVMRDGTQDHDRRDRMATAAAPYVHSKLAQVDASVSGNIDGSITFTWRPPES